MNRHPVWPSRWALCGLVALGGCVDARGKAAPGAAQRPKATPPPDMSTKMKTPTNLPEHLKRWPGLSVRDGARVVPAPPADEALARNYPTWPRKGAVQGGRRLSIATAKATYAPNEEVRVLHVVEVTEPGQQVYVMGPKPVLGEHVDGKLAGPPVPAQGDPLAPDSYDGRTLPSPAVDYNYDITSHRFATPGKHQIQWRLGDLQSNEVEIEVK